MASEHITSYLVSLHKIHIWVLNSLTWQLHIANCLSCGKVGFFLLYFCIACLIFFFYRSKVDHMEVPCFISFLFISDVDDIFYIFSKKLKNGKATITVAFFLACLIQIAEAFGSTI